MAATVNVVEGNGSGPTWSTVTAARYCTTDSYNPGTANPCVVPSSGTNYSYWKHHALGLSGTFTKINNIRWYTDGTIGWTLGTGGKIVVGIRDTGDNGCPPASYDQATGTVGTTGYYMDDATNGHTYYKDQTATPADVTTYTSGSPLTVDTSDYTTTTTATNAVVTQVLIDSDATQGEQADETFTFVYDEV